MEAILFIGHGSRSKSGNDQFKAFIESVYERVNQPIKAFGFLENAHPSIMEAIEGCIKQKATSITVIPVLLLPGIHANVDIPTELEIATKQYPNVTIQYGKPLGVDEILIDIIEDRLASKGFLKEENDSVLLVGHGSREPNAQVEFEEIKSLLNNKGYSRVITSYLKIDPYYNQTIRELAEKGNQQLFVVPHLLFANSLFEKMNETIEELNVSYHSIVLCDPTGFDERIIDLLLIRVNEAIKAPLKVWDGR